MQQIGADARRAADLTRQLLAFARKQEVAPQVVRVDDRARSLEKMLDRVVGASISIETSFAAQSWPVFIDPGQLEQVIVNLAINARDAMPSGGRLVITTENVSIGAGATGRGGLAAGDYVLLTVADTGCGMSPEVALHAFEPFFSTKGDQGTGLGLATCYGIVTQAGGAIAFDSAPGASTRFRIHLPRAAAVVATSGERQAVSLQGSETILVVEDDAAVRRLAVRSLEQLGYQVMCAGSASEAHAKLLGNAMRVDCLVIDVQLPDAEGCATADRILDARQRIPILFMSGSPDALAAPTSGDTPSAFLAKPFAPIDLAREVRALLEGCARRS